MADAIVPLNECIVYWLYDDRCVCPWRHGYIGISSDLKGRLKNHRRKFKNGFSLMILFRGTPHECRAFEWRMRPVNGIGWNKTRGGGKHRFGICHSINTRERMSISAKLRPPISIETREKFRIASTGRTNRGRFGQKKSDEERAKIAAGHRGVPESAEARRKLSGRMKGKKYHLGHLHSEETKERIRIKKTGVAIHSEEEKRKRAERWKGNTLTKGKPWSAARRLAWLAKKES
jgi:NUMOD3 motif